MRDINRIDNFLKLLGDEWKRQSPDLRFGQFLENSGMVNNSLFYKEESEMLFEYFPNIPKREYIQWGTRGKDGKQPIKHVYIKDLESVHIKAILDTQTKISKTYREIFENELQYRRKLKIKILLNK